MEERPTKHLWQPSRQLRRLHKPASHVFSKLSFLILHHLWFIGTCLTTSVILWATAPKSHPLKYIDAIFLTTSAMTEAGLTTVALASLTTFHQAILFFLIFIGSAVFVSSTVIQVRKRTFEARLRELVEHRHTEIARLKNAAHIHAKNSGCQYIRLQPDTGDAVDMWSLPNPDDVHVRYHLHRELTTDQPSRHASSTISPPPLSLGLSQASPVANFSSASQNHGLYSPEPTQNCFEHVSDGNSLSELSQWWTKRARERSVHLQKSISEAERDRLGGIEYRALKFLTWIVPLYVICFQLFGCIGCGAYLYINRPEVAHRNEQNPFWTGAFYAVSAFNNNGMALNDLNMSALRTSYYMLITLSLLILAGNTCFPPFLRLIVWGLKQCLPGNGKSQRVQEWRTVLTFILNHPQRVYTLLFPSEATWWLVLALVVLNGIDWFAFEIFNITNPAVTNVPTSYRVLMGLFQALAVRKGGFFVVSPSALYPGTLVMYVVMMYVNALPIRTAIATTSKYEEQSLEIGLGETIETVASQAEHGVVLHPIKSPRSLLSFRTHGNHIMTAAHAKQLPKMPQKHNRPTGRLPFLRDQLTSTITQDIWWIALAVLLITVIETPSVINYPDVFSVFNIAFEVVSGWGTVGISTGLPWDVCSFCGDWHTLSKLILTAMMMRGRHVGLPGAIDRAILLPEVSLAWSRAQDVRIECACGRYTTNTAAEPAIGPANRNRSDEVQ